MGTGELKVLVYIVAAMVLVVVAANAMMTVANPSITEATQFLENNGFQVIPATAVTDITAIKAKTDNLPATPADQTTLNLVDADVTSIKAKTDNLPADPADQSLLTASIEAVELDAEYAEQHLHHRTAWYGKLSTANATHWADSNTLTSPYVATSGNNAWGTGGTDPAQLFGTGDELPELGKLNSGDFAQIYVIANSSDTLYRMKIVWGTGTLDEAIAAGQWSEGVYLRKSTDTVRLPRMVECPLIPFYQGALPTKVWMICWNASNDATISFYIGAHGYNL